MAKVLAVWSLLLGMSFPAGLLAADAPETAARAAFEASGRLQDPREVRFAGVRQLTFGGENAEAYWSPDGSELIFQSTRPPYACDQIFRLPADGSAEPALVSTGQGRTTCAYFTYPQAERVLFASTHHASTGCPPVPDRSQGYVWPIYASYELYSARPDGTDLLRLTDNDAYDAEATLCPLDGSIVFTSTRDGDLDLYRMDADGGNLRRLTNTPGYDGGAFFSADCSQLVWRASRFYSEEELADYRRLLAEGLVRPGQLEIWVASADGSEARQITYLGAASFAPFFLPSGERVIFSSNYGSPSQREFDLWAVNADGSGLERITYAPGFDGFPMFSPDGRYLAFGSNRNQGKPGETDIYVARWVEEPRAEAPAAGVALPVDRYRADVAWLADDARMGRGIGTAGLDQAAAWFEQQLRDLGAEPAGEQGGYRQAFQVPVAVTVEPATALAVDGRAVDAEQYRPASFSASGSASGELVVAGYGITAPELGVDDYQGVDAAGKVVLVRRFTPGGDAFAGEAAERRYSDLRYKAFNAREHGAVALLVVDLPVVGAGEELPEEAPLPSLGVDARGDAGIPVLHLTRATAAELLAGAHRVESTVALRFEYQTAYNVVGRIAAGHVQRLDGAVLVGAHYDHLGLGGHGSLEPGVEAPHNGADDNASGTAALLEIGRRLVAERAQLQRDVYLAAFSGEELGLLGATAWTRHPTSGLQLEQLVAMLNLDMVGRLRGNRLTVLGGDSAAEWSELVQPLCAGERIYCQLGGDGYGPSDQTPFYAAGIPVLHFFSGAHDDYHRPSDDVEHINAAGGAHTAGLVAKVAAAVANRPQRLTLQQASPAPPVQGDSRSYGASLGTIPDYAGAEDGAPGVLLAGARPGSPADVAGLRRGDRMVELGGKQVKDIYDFVFILRQAKPGDRTTVVVIRDGERLELPVTLGARQRNSP